MPDLDRRLKDAQAKMDEAKRQFTNAAQAVLEGAADAALKTRIALAQVEEARTELRRLNEQETET